MKQCIKPLAIAMLSIPLAGGLFALDTGLELSNAVGDKNTGEADWYTDHKLTGWLRLPLGTGTENALSVEGSLYAAKPANETDLNFFADLDLCRLSLVPVAKPGFRVALDAGRIPVADASGLILNQTVDGAEAHASFKAANIDFLAGYTGLQNAQKDGALMTTDDFADSDATDIYPLGSSRILGKATAQFPQLIKTNDLIVQAVGQYDMRRYIDSDPDQVVDTSYFSVILNGPVAQTLFYSLTGTFQSGILEENDKKYSENSALASARLDWYPVKKNHGFLQVVYTPPEGDFFSEYLPITFQAAGDLYGLGYGDLTRISAGWSAAPLSILNVDIAGKAFVYSEKPDGVDSAYQGTEVSGGATVKATSDLRLRLNGAAFWPQDEDMQYQISLKAIFDL